MYEMPLLEVEVKTKPISSNINCLFWFCNPSKIEDYYILILILKTAKFNLYIKNSQTSIGWWWIALLYDLYLKVQILLLSYINLTKF